LNHPAREVEENSKTHIKISVSEMILSILLNYPKVFKKGYELINNKDFSKECEDIYTSLVDQYNSTRPEIGKWNFDNGLVADLREKINVMLLFADDRYGEFSEEAIGIELVKLIDRLKKDCKMQKLKDLEIRIKEAEKNSEKEKLLKLLTEQQSLLST